MYKQKLCLSTSKAYGISLTEQIRLFKKTGFEGFFVLWQKGMDEEIKECYEVAKEENMIFQSIHAPWGYAQDLWDENEKEDARKGVEELKHCLDLCKMYAVPVLVSHVFVGFDVEYKPTEFGLQNYGEVIDYAEKIGVKIAFENTEGIEYLKALFERYGDREAMGFCWDSGHEMCYNFSEDLLSLFGHKLYATHINDNLGVKDFNGRIFWHDDLHLLPFDGVADWDYNAKRLVKCGYKGILTFELNKFSKPDRHENDKYARMSIEEYVAEAYCRACRVAQKMQNAKCKMQNVGASRL